MAYSCKSFLSVATVKLRFTLDVEGEAVRGPFSSRSAFAWRESSCIASMALAKPGCVDISTSPDAYASQCWYLAKERRATKGWRRVNDKLESMSEKPGKKKKTKGTTLHVTFCKPLPAFHPSPSLALASLVHDILATLIALSFPSSRQIDLERNEERNMQGEPKVSSLEVYR